MKVFGKEVNPKIIKVTLVLLFVFTLFPPYTLQPPGYHVIRREWGFLFNPPGEEGSYGMSIDVLTLIIEYVLILFLMGIVHIFIKDKNSEGNEQ